MRESVRKRSSAACSLAPRCSPTVCDADCRKPGGRPASVIPGRIRSDFLSRWTGTRWPPSLTGGIRLVLKRRYIHDRPSVVAEKYVAPAASNCFARASRIARGWLSDYSGNYTGPEARLIAPAAEGGAAGLALRVVAGWRGAAGRWGAMRTPSKPKGAGMKPPPTPEDMAAASLVHINLSPSPFGAQRDAMTEQMFSEVPGAMAIDGEENGHRTSIIPKDFVPAEVPDDVGDELSVGEEEEEEPSESRESIIPVNKPPTPAASTGRGSTGRGSKASVGKASASKASATNAGTRASVGGARRASELWSEAEDQLLRIGVAKHANRNWKSIAEGLENKTAIQCLHRWRKVLDPQVVKGPWTTEEDEKIRMLVTERGPQKWSAIAKHLPGRMGKQCRERWHNHLDPNIKKGPWSDEEVRSPP